MTVHETPLALVEPRCSFFDITYVTMPLSTDGWNWSPNVDLLGGVVGPRGAGLLISGTDADEESLSYRVGLMSGVWNFKLFYVAYTETGRITVTIGDEVSEEVETWRDEDDINFTRTGVIEDVHTGLVVDNPGIKLITITKTGSKHADSTGYGVLFGGLSGVLLP